MAGDTQFKELEALGTCKISQSERLYREDSPEG